MATMAGMAYCLKSLPMLSVPRLNGEFFVSIMSAGRDFEPSGEICPEI